MLMIDKGICAIWIVIIFSLGMLCGLFVAAVGKNNREYDAYTEGYSDGLKKRGEENE